MCYQNISQTELLIKGHKDPAINLLGHHKIKSKGGIYYPKLTSLSSSLTRLTTFLNARIPVSEVV